MTTDTLVINSAGEIVADPGEAGLAAAQALAAQFGLAHLTIVQQHATADSPRPGGGHSSPLLQFFAYAHLPSHLQSVSRPFGDLAATLEASLPVNPEKTTALRKLLEAKDCAVRAVLFQP